MTNWSAIKIAIMNFFRPISVYDRSTGGYVITWTNRQKWLFVILPLVLILLIVYLIKKRK